MKSQNVKSLWDFFAFLEKRSLTVKFLKLCSESFHRLTDRRCCVVQISWNLTDGKSAKSCIIYRTQKYACLSNCRAQNLQTPAPNNVLRVLQFSFQSVHFGEVIYERVNTAKSCVKVNPIFGGSYSFQPNNQLVVKSTFVPPWFVLCKFSVEKDNT